MKTTVTKDLCYSCNLYDLRKTRGISQARMAQELGISERAVRKIEYCQEEPALGLAYRIATYFDLLVQEVFPLLDEALPKSENAKEGR